MSTATITKGAGRPDAYRVKDGTRVAGVTTIISRFKDSGALMHWAFTQGQSGAATLYEQRDEAGAAGHLVHEWVQNEIHDLPPPKIPDSMRQRCESAYGAWEEWFKGSRMEIVATEVPLVSASFDGVGRASR